MKQRMLVEFDKAGAEWVIVAYCAGDPRMIEVVESGQSPHEVTGNLITGAPIELIQKERKIIGEMTDAVTIDELRRAHLPEMFEIPLLFFPRIFSIRQMAKKSNHGLNYMMGAREFSYQTEMEERDCKKIIDLYTRRAYPNIPLWWESIKRELKNNDRVVMNCFGRKRRFLEAWGADLWKQAIAHVPQSTNVDMLNGGMIACYNDDKLMEIWDLLEQVHDSLLMQVVVGDWKRIAADAMKIDKYLTPLCVYGGREFRVATEMKVGKSWGHMQSVKLTRDLDKFAADLRRTWEGLNDGKKAA